MTECIRKGQFDPEEKHKCFVKGCKSYCYPAKALTCSVCNFKFCEAGHCACNLSKEAQYAVKILYETYCEYCQEVVS